MREKSWVGEKLDCDAFTENVSPNARGILKSDWSYRVSYQRSSSKGVGDDLEAYHTSTVG
jgi:hypothetical protein